MKKLLIADSGSTKTSWLLITDEGRTAFETQGINPIRDSEETIRENLPSPSSFTAEIVAVFFYGAGCIPPYADNLRRLLQERFPHAQVSVASDLLGAAHALLGHCEGIACILGTGSNSCLYDGHSIVENVSPLGWILGDEGSGAVLGRNLVGDLLKGQMEESLLQAFTEETGLTRAHIINKVYREPMPNRFLASLVPFLGKHRQHPQIHDFLISNFRRFFQRNVAQYRRADLPVSFVGGVAQAFRDELAEAARLEGFRLGTVLQRPIDAIADFILQEQKETNERKQLI